MIAVFLFILLGAEAKAEITPEQDLKRGMWTLNTWAIGNMAVGVPISLQSADPQTASFYQMNAGWNVINAALATPPLLRPKPVDPKRLATLFWVNAGLDVGYMAAGIWMHQRGIASNDPQLMGWGQSIVLQGGFLFAFDSAMGFRMMSHY
ncbi:MAG: DUF6992 family protein [Myxococcota bacterium]